MESKLTVNSIKKNSLLSVIATLFILVSSCLHAQNDTLYFNQKWKITVKDSAAFYRIKPTKIKTKNAIGYPIKGKDSLYIIRDYYLSNNQIQFKGYSTDYDAKYLAGKAEWFNESGKKTDSQEFNYQEDNNRSRFRIPELPIFYIDYKIAVKSEFTGGIEFCLNCENDNKLFLGTGFGFTNYNGTSYGLPDIHLSYNTQYLLFVKGGASNKHVYTLAGFTLLNMLDLGIGYSKPFSTNSQPVIKGFTFGATFRFAGNSKKAYTAIKIM